MVVVSPSMRVAVAGVRSVPRAVVVVEHGSSSSGVVVDGAELESK